MRNRLVWRGLHTAHDLQNVEQTKNEDMKQLFRSTFIGLAVALTTAFASCSDVEREEGGVMRVKLSADASMLTRADVGIVAPEASAFALEVSATEGDYSNRWESLTELTGETRFDVGEYRVKATYGTLDEEGFDKPCFEAESGCRIMPNQTTVVNMTATLANSGVQVSFSEAFLKYFAEWSVELVSAAGARIPFVEGESRVAFVAPEPFDIEVGYTKPNGTEGRKTIAVAEVDARTLYRVKLDVNGGEVGAAKIVVTFDGETEKESVEIEINEQ